MNFKRIGIAFNCRLVNSYSYDNIYPIPYWLPIKYMYKINKNSCLSKNVWKTIHRPVTEEMITTGQNIPEEESDEERYYRRDE